jgi:formylglycine-generating enzyme required for sulfatase activity
MNHPIKICCALSLLMSCSDDSAPAVQDVGTPDQAVAEASTGGDGGAKEQGSMADAGVDSGGVVLPSKWITVKQGTFTMGSPSGELCRRDDEAAHAVTLTRSFELGEKEVTQAHFLSLMGYNPSFNSECGEACPVEWVSWHEATAYCNALSRAQGLESCYACQGSGAAVACQPAVPSKGSSLYDCRGYRLPTEAEWEYAARAETSTPLYNGKITSCMTTDGNADKIGWYKVNSSGAPHPVGEKDPNNWGFYDLAGNVYEWVNDWYQPDLGQDVQADPLGAINGTERVFRGGAWYFNAEHLRSAHRLSYEPTKRFTFLGFRCARSL